MQTLAKICAAALLLTATIPAFAASLSDVANSRNKTAIEYLNEKGVIGGYPDGAFRPLNAVNRAELLKILVGGKGASPTIEDYNNCFPDVTSEWFAPFVCYAKEQGWVDGYPDGTFRPSNTVNTVEAIKMVVNSQGYQVSDAASTYLYDDVDNGAWYAPYVKMAKDKGILEQTNGSLGTTSDMKRGGISEVIYRSMYIREQSLDRFVIQKNVSSMKSSSSSSSVVLPVIQSDPNAAEFAKIIRNYEEGHATMKSVMLSYEPPYSTLMDVLTSMYSVFLVSAKELSQKAQTRTLTDKENDLFLEELRGMNDTKKQFLQIQQDVASGRFEPKEAEPIYVPVPVIVTPTAPSHEDCMRLRRQINAQGLETSPLSEQYLREQGC